MLRKEILRRVSEETCGRGTLVAKARAIFAGCACKERFDKRELRKRKPFFILEKGLRGNQLLFLLYYLSSFKKHLSRKTLHRAALAIIHINIIGVLNLSFCFNLPIILIEQNNSKLVMHLGSREKCGKAN